MLAILGRLATYALNLTGIFYYQLPSDLRADEFQNQNPSTLEWVSNLPLVIYFLCSFLLSKLPISFVFLVTRLRLIYILSIYCRNNSGECSTHDLPSKDETPSNLVVEIGNDSKDAKEDRQKEATMLQKGILRTNCIDCLDRTNVAQYAYGLVAFGRQLHALGLTVSTTIDLDNPLAEDLMGIYETMGDTLALQYGGSAAHNKVSLLALWP